MKVIGAGYLEQQQLSVYTTSNIIQLLTSLSLSLAGIFFNYLLLFFLYDDDEEGSYRDGRAIINLVMQFSCVYIREEELELHHHRCINFNHTKEGGKRERKKEKKEERYIRSRLMV